jgi:hypothetical protein
MKILRKIGAPLLVGMVLTALVTGGVVLTSTPVQAGTPILLCGPTILWVCSGPGGPDVLFGGTVCEKAEYEKETGRTCVPYGG